MTSFGEAMKHGDEGWWEDWAALLRPWGFDPGDIRVPVQLWHGGNDASVPASQGRQLATQIPGVDAHLPVADRRRDRWGTEVLGGGVMAGRSVEDY